MAERLKAEQDDFARRAADRRADGIRLRKQKRWLDALQADSRASEYRQSRDARAAELKRIRPFVDHERRLRDPQRKLTLAGDPQ
jgi:hypothetical protein